MTKVKICGNTNPMDAQLAVQYGADYLGLIFAESKRKIDIRIAGEIIESLPYFKNIVGVFLNQPKKEVESIVRELGINLLQFHGDETSLYCQHFMDRGFKVIKTFRIKDAMSLKRIEEYDVAYYLFDTYSKDSSGGTGLTFDWTLIQSHAYIAERLFLAGGLNIHNVQNAVHMNKPYAVDVASGVEAEPGKKDLILLEKFIRLVKEGENASRATLHP